MSGLDYTKNVMHSFTQEGNDEKSIVFMNLAMAWIMRPLCKGTRITLAGGTEDNVDVMESPNVVVMGKRYP